MAEERDRQRGQSQADQRENEVTFPHEFDKLGSMGKGGNGLKQERSSLHHIALRRIRILGNWRQRKAGYPTSDLFLY